MTNDADLRIIKLGITNRILINRRCVFFETMGNKKIRVYQCAHTPAALQKYFHLKELPLQIVVKGDDDELVDIQEMEASYVDSNTSPVGSLEDKCPYLSEIFDCAENNRNLQRELTFSNSAPEVLVGLSFIVNLSSDRRTDLLIKNPYLLDLFNQSHQGDRSEDAKIPPLEINVLDHLEKNVYLVEVSSTYNPHPHYRERIFATIGTTSDTYNTRLGLSKPPENLGADQYENYEILDIEPICKDYSELLLEAWCAVQNKQGIGAFLPLKVKDHFISDIPLEQIQSPFISPWYGRSRSRTGRRILIPSSYSPKHYLQHVCENIAAMLSWQQKEKLLEKIKELAWSEKYSFTVDRKEMTPPNNTPDVPFAFTSRRNIFTDESLRDYLGFDGPFSDSELGD